MNPNPRSPARLRRGMIAVTTGAGRTARWPADRYVVIDARRPHPVFAPLRDDGSLGVHMDLAPEEFSITGGMHRPTLEFDRDRNRRRPLPADCFGVEYRWDGLLRVLAVKTKAQAQRKAREMEEGRACTLSFAYPSLRQPGALSKNQVWAAWSTDRDGEFSVTAADSLVEARNYFRGRANSCDLIKPGGAGIVTIHRL